MWCLDASLLSVGISFRACYTFRASYTHCWGRKCPGVTRRVTSLMNPSRRGPPHILLGLGGVLSLLSSKVSPSCLKEGNKSSGKNQFPLCSLATPNQSVNEAPVQPGTLTPLIRRRVCSSHAKDMIPSIYKAKEGTPRGPFAGRRIQTGQEQSCSHPLLRVCSRSAVRMFKG